MKHEIYEIGIDKSNSNILYRIFSLYKYYLLFIPLGFIVVILFKDFNIYLLLIGFCVTMCITFLFCFIVNWKILYSVRYKASSDTIELVSMRGSKVHQELIAERSDIKISVRQNFSYRYPVWQIFFYYKSRLIISQKEVGGWSREMFSEIEKMINIAPSDVVEESE